MKPRLHRTATFNLKLMRVMPVIALSLVLYPAIAKAEIATEKEVFTDSPSQTDKGVENLSPNLSPKRGEALNKTSLQTSPLKGERL